MLVERWEKQGSSPDAGTSPPPLQPVKSPGGITLEGCQRGDRLEGRKMITCGNLWDVFRTRVRPIGDGLPGSN